MIGQLLHSVAATTYNYTTTSTASKTGWTIYFIVLIAIWILSIIALWKVFSKAGKPGWAAIIPIYNTWTLFEVGGKPGWWALLFFLPILDVVALIMFVLALIEVSARFGKSVWFTLLYFIVGLGFFIIGFGKATYSANGATAIAATPAPSAPSDQPPAATPPTDQAAPSSDQSTPASNTPDAGTSSNDSSNQQPPAAPPSQPLVQ